MLIRLLLITFAILAPGCASVRLREKTFAIASPQGQSVNGAAIDIQLEGLGGGNGAFSISAMVYSAAMTSTKGPYAVSLYAVGEAGRHETMTVHTLRISTPERGPLAASEVTPGIPILFSPTRRKGLVQAVHHVSSPVDAEFGRDSELRIEALISVRTTDQHEVKKWVRLKLTPQDRTRSEFVVVPSEIYHSLKNRGIPFDDSDTGANRAGWKQ